MEVDTQPVSATGKWQAEQADIDSVVAALDHSHHLSLASRNMFREIAQHGVLSSPDERHEFQVLALSMLGEVLRETRTGLEHAIELAGESWEGAQQAEACAREHEAQAKDPIVQKRAEIEKVRKLFRDRNIALQKARAALDTAAESERDFAKQVNDMDSLREAMEAAWRDHSEHIVLEKPLVEESVAPSGSPLALGSFTQAEPHIFALLQLIQRVQMDESLMSAFPMAARRRPQLRSAFDWIVLEQFQREFKQHVKTLSVKVSDLRGSLQEKLDATASARAVFDEARLGQAAASTKLREVEAALWSAEDALKAARAQTSTARRQSEAAKAAHEKAQLAPKEFDEGPLQAFTRLHGIA